MAALPGGGVARVWLRPGWKQERAIAMALFCTIPRLSPWAQLPNWSWRCRFRASWPWVRGVLGMASPWSDAASGAIGILVFLDERSLFGEAARGALGDGGEPGG
jgi:hypothetical protein